MTRSRRMLAATATALTVAAGAVVGLSPASAAPRAAGPLAGRSATAAAPILRAVPAPWTPRVVSPKATVRQLVQCGATVYAVGHFDTIRQGGHQYTRHNAFSFDARTGAVRAWDPNVTGSVVDSIALAPHCATAYLGGRFTAVGGEKVHNLAAVTTSSGTLRPRFGHTANGEVETLLMLPGGAQLLVGGAFSTLNGTTRPYYVSVNPASGAATGFLRPRVTGKLPHSKGRSMVYNQQLSPKHDRLLIEGDFAAVGGRVRHQLAELNVGPHAITVNGWHNYRLNNSQCSPNVIFYGRAATFSPNEKTIYLAASGFNGSSPYCDALTAFTNTAPATVRWINKTGGDSLYSVAAAAHEVFVGGHERWADNPYGLNSCGNGCTKRPGIGSIGVPSGKATSWNPTRSRGHGADDLLLTRAGLWIASDTYFNSTQCAGRYRPGICFFHRRG